MFKKSKKTTITRTWVFSEEELKEILKDYFVNCVGFEINEDNISFDADYIHDPFVRITCVTTGEE